MEKEYIYILYGVFNNEIKRSFDGISLVNYATKLSQIDSTAYCVFACEKDTEKKRYIVWAAPWNPSRAIASFNGIYPN